MRALETHTISTPGPNLCLRKLRKRMLSGKRRAGALIVVPLSVLRQFAAQLTHMFLVADALRVIVFYGKERHKQTSKM